MRKKINMLPPDSLAANQQGHVIGLSEGQFDHKLHWLKANDISCYILADSVATNQTTR